MRARLHVQDRRIGFFLEGTHTLCDAASTHQLRPDTHAALDALIVALGTTADNVLALETRPRTAKRPSGPYHLEARGDADTSRLGSVTVPGITGVSFSHPRSPRIHVVSGDGRVTDRFVRGEREWAVSRSPSAFFQGNRYLLDTLVNHVVDRLGSGGGVTDLYAGAGLFSIAAAAHGLAPVMAVEGDPRSAAELRRNSAPWRGLIQARHAPVEDYVRDRRLVRSHTVLLDPPRTGLSRRALQGTIALRSPRIVYVSCDVATLARDTRALIDAGYGIGEVVLFDLFPNTAHVESVVVFDLTGYSLPWPLAGNSRTAAGIRRCARSSPGATARRRRSGSPGCSIASITPSGAVARHLEARRHRLAPPDDAGC